MDTAAIVAKVERFSNLGALKVHQRDLQKALEAYSHAFQSVMLLGHNNYMQRACAFNLGAIYISLGSYTEGLTYLRLAEPPDGHHDGSSNADLYFNYGVAYEGLRNAAEMKHYYNKALKEYKLEKDNVKTEADVLSRLGKVYVESGLYHEAESCVRQLVQIYENLEDFPKQLQIPSHVITNGHQQHQCPFCYQNYITGGNMLPHIQEVHHLVRYICHVCGLSYTRADSFLNQLKQIHPSNETTSTPSSTTMTPGPSSTVSIIPGLTLSASTSRSHIKRDIDEVGAEKVPITKRHNDFSDDDDVYDYSSLAILPHDVR